MSDRKSAVSDSKQQASARDGLWSKLHAKGWHAWAIPLVVLVVFARALRNGFAFDDKLVIIDTAEFLSHPTLSDLFSARYFELTGEATYRPVVSLSYILDAQLGGLDPFAYHLQSVAWHAGVALLVYALGRRLFASPWPALAAALLFAVHPIVTEAIDNPSYREDPLVTFFAIGAILLTLRNSDKALWLAALSYAVALFSKEMAIVTPLLLLGLRLYLPAERAIFRTRWPREAAAFGLTTAFYASIRFGAMAGGHEFAGYPGGTLGGALATEPSVIAHYVRLVFLPWPLCADYRGIYDFASGMTTTSAVCLALLALAGWGIYRLYRIDPLAAFGASWFFAAMLPVMNILPIPVPVAERYLYLPLVGFCIAVVRVGQLVAARTTPKGSRALVAAGCVVATAFAAETVMRHPIWHDNLALFQQTASEFPTSYGAHWGLGVYRYKVEHNVKAAIEEFEAASRLRTTRIDGARIMTDLKTLYAEAGRPQDAMRVASARVDLESSHDAIMNVALQLMSEGNLPEAKRAFERGIRTAPYTYNAKAYAMLAQMAEMQGDPAEAQRMIKMAMQLDVKDQDVQNVAMQIFQHRNQGGVAPPAPAP